MGATVTLGGGKKFTQLGAGQYGCGTAGAIVNGNESSLTGLPNTGNGVLARKIYCQVKSVELHVGYIHPSEPYIPPSQSIRYSPIQVTERKVEGTSLNETFVVPPSTKSVMIFMRQDANHVCIDRELDSKAGAGVNVLGDTDTAGTLDDTADRTGPMHAGTFVYDSKDIFDALVCKDWHVRPDQCVRCGHQDFVYRPTVG